MAKKNKKSGALFGALVAISLLGSVIVGCADDSTPAPSTHQDNDQASISVIAPIEDVPQETPGNTETPDVSTPVEPTAPQAILEQAKENALTIETNPEQSPIQDSASDPIPELYNTQVQDTAQTPEPPEEPSQPIVIPAVATTDNSEAEPEADTEPVVELIGTDYILNKNTKKFHYPECSSVKKMKDKNKGYYTGTRDEVIAMGYDSCGNCHP